MTQEQRRANCGFFIRTSAIFTEAESVPCYVANLYV